MLYAMVLCIFLCTVAPPRFSPVLLLVFVYDPLSYILLQDNLVEVDLRPHAGRFRLRCFISIDPSVRMGLKTEMVEPETLCDEL